MEAVSSVILCGGHSRRMGRDKASLPRDKEGRLQPLCDVCRKTALSLPEDHLSAGKCKLIKAVASLNITTIPALEMPGGIDGICNANTPAQWMAAKAQQRRMQEQDENR